MLFKHNVPIALIPHVDKLTLFLNVKAAHIYHNYIVFMKWWIRNYDGGTPTGSHHDSLSTWKFDPTFLSNLVCGHQMLIVVLSALTTRPVLEAGCYIYDRLGQLNKIKSLSFPSPLYWIGLTQQRRADQIARRWYRYFRK